MIRLKRFIVCYNQSIIAFTTALYAVLISSPSVMACVGFGCDAADYLKSNTIVSSAGQSAVDLITFPFFIITAIVFFIIFVVIAVTMGAFAEGRDWGSGLIKLVGLFGVAMFGAALITFMVSGTFGGTGGGGAVVP
jgi:hypothetical protein